MDPTKTANRYYDAWINHGGDMTDVPLAPNFSFTGPVASFNDAAGFRQMAAQAGAAVRSFRVRHQFRDGDLVCTVVDWEMAPVIGVLTAAEILEIRDDRSRATRHATIVPPQRLKVWPQHGMVRNLGAGAHVARPPTTLLA